jgi:hypothetical protein
MSNRQKSREEAFAVLDDLLIEEGSLEAITIRKAVEVVGGGSSRGRAYREEWLAERQQWLSQMPDTLESQLRQFLERLWLIARVRAAQYQSNSNVRVVSTGPAGVEALYDEIDEMKRVVDGLTAELKRRPTAVQVVAPERISDMPEQYSPTLQPGVPFSQMDAKAASEEDDDLVGEAFVGDVISFSELTIDGQEKADESEGVPSLGGAQARATKPDWENAKNTAIARRLAGILRRHGFPMRAKQFKNELLASFPNWTPSNFAAAIKHACVGSKLAQIKDDKWWFEGEEIPRKNKPKSSDAIRRQDAEGAFAIILNTIMSRKDPVSFDELLEIAQRDKFDKEWLRKRLDVGLVRYAGQLVLVDAGYLWIQDANTPAEPGTVE